MVGSEGPNFYHMHAVSHSRLPYSILRLLLKALRHISMAARPKENIIIWNKVFWVMEALIKDINKKVLIMALDGRRWIILMCKRKRVEKMRKKNIGLKKHTRNT